MVRKNQPINIYFAHRLIHFKIPIIRVSVETIEFLDIKKEKQFESRFVNETRFIEACTIFTFYHFSNFSV